LWLPFFFFSFPLFCEQTAEKSQPFVSLSVFSNLSMALLALGEKRKEKNVISFFFFFSTLPVFTVVLSFFPPSFLF